MNAERLARLKAAFEAVASALGDALDDLAQAEPPAAGNADELLTVPQLAAELHIDRDYAYDLARTGEVPSIHLGRLVRVRRGAVSEWMRKVEHGRGRRRDRSARPA